jgi:phosphatidylethanolamine/phosphatidyl-N-methylethanolamine N-methyltransferase
MDTRSIEKAYQRYANIYDLTFGRIFHGGRAVSVDLLGPQAGEKILEVGVGTGLTLPFFPSGCNVTGIDLSEHMLEKARLKVEAQGMKHVEVMRMDAMKMEFPDDHFDSIIAAYVISVVPDPVQVLKEMSRVCKKGGKIVFINHFKCDNSFIAFIERLVSPLSRLLGFKTDLELEPLLAQLPELKIEKVEGVNLFNYWKVVEGTNNK